VECRAGWGTWSRRSRTIDTVGGEVLHTPSVKVCQTGYHYCMSARRADAFFLVPALLGILALAFLVAASGVEAQQQTMTSDLVCVGSDESGADASCDWPLIRNGLQCIYGKPCQDTRKGVLVRGKCIAILGCKGEEFKNQNGTWQKIETGEDSQSPPPSGTGTNAEPPPSDTQPEPLPPQPLDNRMFDGSALSDGAPVRETPDPSQALSPFERIQQLTKEAADTVKAEWERLFSPDTLDNPVTLQPIQPVEEPDIGTLFTEETFIPPHSGFTEESQDQENGWDAPQNANDTFSDPEPDASLPPSENSSPCSGFDYICKAQEALGLKPVPEQEDSKKNAEMREATIYYPGCRGAPSGCSLAQEGGLLGSRNNLIDPNLTIAAGPNSGLKFGDVVEITDPLTGNVLGRGVVGDVCPGCGTGVDLSSGLAKTVGLTEQQGRSSFGFEVVSRGNSWADGLKVASNLNSGGGSTVFTADANASGLERIQVASTAGYALSLYDQVASQAPPAPPSSAYAGAQNYSGNSVVDFLSAVGQATDFASRAILATQFNISNYKGTGAQNIQLLKQLRGR